MLHRIRRPSPALVLAFIAVFLLGAGGAVGASKVIDGKKIKKGSIPLSALSKGAKKGITGPQGPQGIQGAQGTPGAKGDKGDAGTPATRLFGVVEADGDLYRNSGIVAPVSHGAGPASQGIYDVSFTQNVSNCAITASIGQAGTAGGDIAGFISTRLIDDDTVRVNTADVNNDATDYPFHIAVFCA